MFVTWRLERFLMGAAVSPPTARWASTLDDEGGDDGGVDCNGGGLAGGTEGLFAHQRRSVAWCEAIEVASGDEAQVHVRPMALGGRLFGIDYKVPLPTGGVLAHPPVRVWWSPEG